MKIRTLKYFVKESSKSVKRNKVMSLASISTVSAALFIFGVFMLLIINVNGIINSVEAQIEIKVFLNDDITTLKQQALESDIKSIQGVRSVKFESKEDALINFKEQLGENSGLANGLEIKNPLPASYIIKVNSPKDVDFVSGKIKGFEGIYKIVDGKQTIDKLIQIIQFIKGTSLILMLILGIISVFLISNTIKITVFARKREIGIMKYVGATDWFIKWPFILEGIMLGFIGALISIAILGFGYNYLASTIASGVIVFSLVPIYGILNSLIWQFVVVGMIIGGAGSLISLRKFLVV